jgi:TatD DNase family protein
MNESWCDVHAHARPVHFVNSTVVCLSHQEIIDHKTQFRYFSVGIHPWWLENIQETELHQLKSDVAALVKHPHAVAVGETGLDRLYKNTWDKQVELFKWHWDLAEQFNRPMVIHKVRSGSDFLGFIKIKKPRTPWIFHDYNGTGAEISDLLRLHPDCYFSFGDSLLHRQGTSGAVDSIDLSRLFIETDEESQLQLPHYYEKLAQIKSTTLLAVEQQMALNFSKIFKIS